MRIKSGLNYIPCSFLHNMPAIHVSWNSITTRSLLRREIDMTKFQPLIKNTNETKGYAVFQGETLIVMMNGSVIFLQYV